jgi:uncharacterized protein
MMFFEHADGVLTQMAAEWKKQQADYQEYQQTGGTYHAFKDFGKK